MMDKQSISVFSYKLLEPATFVSDIIIAIACYLFYLSIKKISQNKLHLQVSFFFLFMGFSGMIGAFAHLLALYTGKTLHYVSWIFTGIAVFFIEYSVSAHILYEKRRNLYLLLIKLKLLLFFIFASLLMDFVFIKINTAIGLVGIVSPILLSHTIRFNKKNYIYVVSGIFLAIIPALFHRLDFSVGGVMNMNDVSHFFLVLCLFLMYKGLKMSIVNNQFESVEPLPVEINT